MMNLENVFSHSIPFGVFAIGLLSVSACTGEAETDELADPAGAPEPSVAVQEVTMPDTTLEAVWTHLQEEAYRESWEHWPGKRDLYSGGEPHGMLLTTYVNDVALDALENGAASMPSGAIIVKENFMPDSVLAAVTVMYKTDSFNPEHRNWWFLKRNADETVDAAGRGAGCENCHGQRADNDYILTSDLGLPIGGG